jgi:hypothetical protein
MGPRHCNLSRNDLEIVFKTLSREKLNLQNNDKYDQKKDPPIAAQTTKCTKHTVASLSKGDEGSENGMFEDPLCSPLASMAWTLPVRADASASVRTHVRVRADASVLPPGNFKKDTTVRPSHGRPRGHRLTVRPSVRPSVRPLLSA